MSLTLAGLKGTIMSMTYKKEAKGLLVTTTGKNGNTTNITLAYENALEAANVTTILQNHARGAASFRGAALTLMNIAQKTGMLKDWFGGQKVTQDLLKKMKDAEEFAGQQFGLTPEDWRELRQPGQYADTRSAMLKAWTFGETLEVGLDSKGISVLLTMNGLRKINASHRKAPETKGLDDYLETLAQYLTSHPEEAVGAEARVTKILSEARSLLDNVAKQAIAQAETSDEVQGPIVVTPIIASEAAQSLEASQVREAVAA